MRDPSARKEGELRSLPSVEQVAQRVGGPDHLAVAAARTELERARAAVLNGGAVPNPDEITAAVAVRAAHLAEPSLRRVVNATGVVLHTNLGRAPLPTAAVDHLAAVAAGYSNLEYDLESGQRGSRSAHFEGLITGLSGAEAAVAVNSEAPAESAAAADPMSPGGDVMGPSVNGTVTEIRLPDTLVLSPYYVDLYAPPAGVSRPEGDELAVKLDSESQLSRVGPTSIDGYQVGDKLIAYVRWGEAGELVAIAVEPLFQTVQGVVSDRVDDRLVTSGGSVLLTEHTLLLPPGGSSAARSTQEISKGMTARTVSLTPRPAICSRATSRF